MAKKYKFTIIIVLCILFFGISPGINAISQKQDGGMVPIPEDIQGYITFLNFVHSLYLEQEILTTVNNQRARNGTTPLVLTENGMNQAFQQGKWALEADKRWNTRYQEGFGLTGDWVGHIAWPEDKNQMPSESQLSDWLNENLHSLNIYINLTSPSNHFEYLEGIGIAVMAANNGNFGLSIVPDYGMRTRAEMPIIQSPIDGEKVYQGSKIFTGEAPTSVGLRVMLFMQNPNGKLTRVGVTEINERGKWHFSDIPVNSGKNRYVAAIINEDGCVISPPSDPVSILSPREVTLFLEPIVGDTYWDDISDTLGIGGDIIEGLAVGLIAGEVDEWNETTATASTATKVFRNAFPIMDMWDIALYLTDSTIGILFPSVTGGEQQISNEDFLWAVGGLLLMGRVGDTYSDLLGFRDLIEGYVKTDRVNERDMPHKVVLPLCHDYNRPEPTAPYQSAKQTPTHTQPFTSVYDPSLDEPIVEIVNLVGEHLSIGLNDNSGTTVSLMIEANEVRDFEVIPGEYNYKALSSGFESATGTVEFEPYYYYTWTFYVEYEQENVITVGDGPLDITRSFYKAIGTQDLEGAIRHVLPDERPGARIILGGYILSGGGDTSGIRYELISQQGDTATIRLFGELQGSVKLIRKNNVWYIASGPPPLP